MKSCSSIVPSSKASTACLLDVPTNLLITKPTFEFANYVAAENSENYRIGIQEGATINALTMYPTLPMRSVAVTKPAPNNETDGSGAQTGTFLPPGSAIVDLKVSACDFKEMLTSMQGGIYRTFIGLGANKLMGTMKPNGVIRGFTGQIIANPIGFPTKDAKLTEMQLHINFEDVEEFNNFVIIELPIALSELTEFTALGLNAMVKTPLAASDMTVKVNQRCTDTLESEVLTAEIVSTNITDTPDVAVGVASNGEYIITLQKSATPEDLVAGDYINYILVTKTTNVYDKVSNVIEGRLWP